MKVQFHFPEYGGLKYGVIIDNRTGKAFLEKCGINIENVQVDVHNTYLNKMDAHFVVAMDVDKRSFGKNHIREISRHNRNYPMDVLTEEPLDDKWNIYRFIRLIDGHTFYDTSWIEINDHRYEGKTRTAITFLFNEEVEAEGFVDLFHERKKSNHFLYDDPLTILLWDQGIPENLIGDWGSDFKTAYYLLKRNENIVSMLIQPEFDKPLPLFTMSYLAQYTQLNCIQRNIYVSDDENVNDTDGDNITISEGDGQIYRTLFRY